MKIEQGELQVVALDKDGFEVSSQFLPSKKEAKGYARRLVDDPELIRSGMNKVEIRDDKGECLSDFFVMAS